MDTLALLGDRERFTSSVEWLGKNLQFNIVSKGYVLASLPKTKFKLLSSEKVDALIHVNLQNKTVSVFETTIRVLGGLLSAHLIASDYATVLFFFLLLRPWFHLPS